MSQHCVKHTANLEEYLICFGWDSVLPMQTFYLTVEIEVDQPIVHVGKGEIHNDAYKSVPKFEAAYLEALAGIGITDFTLTKQDKAMLRKAKRLHL